MCDPCQNGSSHSGRVTFEDVELDTCIMTDEFGRAEFMKLTQDGRWIPIDRWFNGD